jgi:hypothetical protein
VLFVAVGFFGLDPPASVAEDRKLRIGDVIELGGRREVMMVLAQ